MVSIVRWFVRLLLVPGVLLSVSGLPAGVPVVGPAPARISSAAMGTTANGETADVLVVLERQADLDALDANLPRESRGQAVYERLWRTAQTSQRSLRAWLASRGVAYRSFYIVNALLVRVDRELLLALGARSDVSRVMTNPAVAGELAVAPVEGEAQPTLAAMSVPWGVQRIGAPAAWALGYRGEGVVVAGQDTGYNWAHPALQPQYRGWNGSVADHDYNWHDAIHTAGSLCPADSPEPCDDNGHGTHTMGTIVGDDGVSDPIGVAPGARWIGCRNMRQGVGTPASYAECFEFFLAPYPVGGNPAQGDPAQAPHVINNSWSCPISEGCDAMHIAFLEQVVDAVRAAGIVVVSAAGNLGPACGTVSEPPGMYDGAYSVGALDAMGMVASFSSRGTGTSLIKPDIAAPGVGVYSAWLGTGYQITSGTSMAAPHVAGAIALVGSARPEFLGQVDALERVLDATAVARTSAECGDAADAVPNNVYGWGQLDALAAVTAVWGRLEGIVRDQEGVSLTGVRVQAEPAQGPVWSTVTGTGGVYALPVLTGSYTLTVSPSGYLPVTYGGITISADLTTTVDITLTAAIELYLPLFYAAGAALP